MLRNLYIPIENKKRELQAKVLFACVAAENGFKPILGVNREIKHNLNVWPTGIIAWKGLARKGGQTYKYFHSFGHRVVAWCEEGIVYPSPEFYQRFRVFPDALNEVDLFFAWGQNQADDILSKVPEGRDKVIIAGNPRLDLLQEDYRGVFDKEVNEIKNKYNSFILVNTNFSAYTHVLGSETIIENLKKGGRIVTEEDEAIFLGRVKNRKQLFYHFLDMLKELNSTLSNRTIVVRPHPTEDMELWKEAISGLENVQLVRRGSAIPWIIASELLIHNNCTTGLEAYLLGKPVISYRPTAGNPYESRLLIAVSTSAETIDSVKSVVNKILSGDYTVQHHESESAKGILSHYVGNLENEYSVDVITRELKNLACRDLFPRVNMMSKIKAFIKSSSIRIKRQSTNVQNRKSQKKAESEFCNRKFSGLSVDEVKEVVNGLSLRSGRFKKINVMHVSGTETCVQLEMAK